MEATSEMNKPLCFRSTGLSSLGSARSVEAYLSSSHPPHGLLAHRSGRAIASGIGMGHCVGPPAPRRCAARNPSMALALGNALLLSKWWFRQPQHHRPKRLTAVNSLIQNKTIKYSGQSTPWMLLKKMLQICSASPLKGSCHTTIISGCPVTRMHSNTHLNSTQPRNAVPNCCPAIRA